jgi:hypothetical protein
MKTLQLRLVGISAVLLSAIGCLPTVPLTDTLNDDVSMNTKTNWKQDISFDYSSDVSDTTYVPYDKDKNGSREGYQRCSIAPSAALQKMLKKYMCNKFAKLNHTRKVANVTIKFKDFWIEQYSSDHMATQLLAPSLMYETCVAQAKMEVRLEKDTLNVIKILSTSTKMEVRLENNCKQGASIELVHAKNINDCFNKLIILLNSFLEENHL